MPARKAHPALAVGDVEAVAARLAAAGAPVDWDDSLAGRRRFYTADPWGNRIELVSAATADLLVERDERQAERVDGARSRRRRCRRRPRASSPGRRRAATPGTHCVSRAPARATPAGTWTSARRLPSVVAIRR